MNLFFYFSIAKEKNVPHYALSSLGSIEISGQ